MVLNLKKISFQGVIVVHVVETILSYKTLFMCMFFWLRSCFLVSLLWREVSSPICFHSESILFAKTLCICHLDIMQHFLEKKPAVLQYIIILLGKGLKCSSPSDPCPQEVLALLSVRG